MTHGLGYIPEPLESTSDFEPVLCSGSTPPACDNREYCGEITDQGPTGSCVAHAVANAIQFLRRSHWHEDAPKPCILSIYALARVHSGKTLAEDSGSSLRAALRAVTEHGWCPDDAWPWSVDAIHEHEPWSVAQAGYDAIGLQWHVVASNRREMIEAAVFAGLPVLCGTTVDDSFDALRSLDIWPGCSEGGGHCMLIIGYDEEGVIVMNSWGSDWGERGFARIAWSHILSDKTHIVAVLDET